MQVQFDIEEAWAMMSAAIDAVLDNPNVPEKDRAAIRRWRSREMAVTTPAMQLLLIRLNEEIQRTYDRSQVSAIQKPDWA